MDEPVITDEMVTGAIGLSPWQLRGRTIVEVLEIADSDRYEIALLLDDGTLAVISCDPEYAEGSDSIRTNDRWEVVLYDATDTVAGSRLRANRSQTVPTSPDA